MAPKVWSTGEVLTAAQQNVLAAQADAALTPTGNLAGLANKATARDNLDLAAVAATADYDDILNAPIEDNAVASDGAEFIDYGMEVFLTISPTGIDASGFTIGTDGAAVLATIAANTVASGVLSVTDGSHFDASDGAAGSVLIDDGMEVVEKVDADGARTIHGITTSLNDAAEAVEWIDDGMEVMARIGAGGVDFAGVSFSLNDGPAGQEFIDDGMEIIARISASGATDGYAGAGTVHSADELRWRHAENLADTAMTAIIRSDSVCRPVAAYNHFIVYGQSLGQGAEGDPAISTVAKYDNLMLGTIAASVNNVMPAANNATPPTWQVTGSSVFNALVATGYNEIVAHGALNTYRRLTLNHRGIQADAARRMIGTTAAVGGQSIAALAKGATPELYNRLPSLMAQANTAAGVASGDYLVPALLWLQGESNQTTTAATYITALRQFFADFTADVISETEQEDPPAYFLYQTAAPNTNFDTSEMGVQMAQLDAALNDSNVFMAGPNYPYPDSNNLHLVANGYRWLGSLIGKVMFRVLTLGHRWKPLYIRRATLRGREILVDYHVPSPPLVFEDPWMQSGWFIGETATGGTNTQYAVPNKGFTVRTTGGTDLTIASVAFASATQILITLDAAPSAAPNLFYANGRQNHFGHGSVRDSDPTLADDVYLDGQAGQVDGETNAALSGARYPLPNWAVAQFMTVEL